MDRFPWIGALAAMVSLIAAAPGVADPAAAASCRALGGARLPLYPDTVGTVQYAETVPAQGDVQAHCRVTGFATTQVGFEVRLPLTGWNGRLLQQGCRGMCGIIHLDTANDALARGFATAGTDMGHRAANSVTGSWAYNDWNARIDFGHRATHVATLAAKALVERFYGRPASRSYFRGCGTGGRQALVAVQRYPYDFDGVLADGGVVLAFTRLNFALAHFVRANVGKDGSQLLSSDDARRMHHAVLERCDADDGLRDGILSDPASCDFEPAMLSCRDGDREWCLAPMQIEAARRFYEGPRNRRGQQIYPGLPYGSELKWPDAFFGDHPKYEAFPVELLRYFLFQHAPGPGFEQRDLDLDLAPEFFTPVESLVNADNPDLSEFRRRGGKLVIIHGVHEPAMPYAYAVDYYERVARLEGGLDAVQEFFRLFLVPGDMHCSAGIPQGTVTDGLNALVSWVERGQPPDAVVGYRLKREPAYPERPHFPLDPGNVAAARPIFPYPLATRYRGHGDPSGPDSFEAWTPPRPQRSRK